MMGVMIFTVSLLILMAFVVEFGKVDVLKTVLDFWKSNDPPIDGESISNKPPAPKAHSNATRSLSVVKKLLIYSVFVIIGLVCGFMLRPTFPSDENSDIQMPLEWVIFYLFDPTRTLDTAMGNDGDSMTRILDTQRFNDSDEAYAFLQSVFDKSIWYPILGGLMALILAYLIMQVMINRKRNQNENVS